MTRWGALDPSPASTLRSRATAGLQGYHHPDTHCSASPHGGCSSAPIRSPLRTPVTSYMCEELPSYWVAFFLPLQA
jgi:hypothetical protein